MTETKIVHEKYNEQVIQLLELKARDYQQQFTEGIDIEVRVNDKVIIPRTEELSVIRNIREIINTKTAYICVYFYRKTQTAYFEKYYLHLKENKFSRSHPLNGVPDRTMETGITESAAALKERIQMEIHYEQLLKENENLKKQLEEFEKLADRWVKEKKEIIDNRTKGIENLSGILFTGIMNSPYIKERVPFLSNLGGFGQADNREQQQSAENKGTASSVTYQEAVDENDQEFNGVVVAYELEPYAELLNELPTKLGRVFLAPFMEFIAQLSNDPQSIKNVQRYHQDYLKRRNNQQDQHKNERI